MITYKIILVMIMFSTVCACLNGCGWYLTKLPEHKVSITEADVTDLTTSAGNLEVNAWTMYSALKMVFQVIFSAMLALLTIIPFLMAFGMSMQQALIIQTPIWFIMAFSIYQMWSGHSAKMQE